MIRPHSYDVTVAWTGNWGSGTSGYREYGRDHEVTVLAQCHMLSYLHVCASGTKPPAPQHGKRTPGAAASRAVSTAASNVSSRSAW
jgi:hypothetical protein